MPSHAPTFLTLADELSPDVRFEVEHVEVLSPTSLRAVVRSDDDSHRLLAREVDGQLAWDCSCGNEDCGAAGAALHAVRTAQARSERRARTAAQGRKSAVRIFYRLYRNEGGLFAEAVVGAAPAADLPHLEPERALGEPQPRFVGADDVPILEHLSVHDGALRDADVVKRIICSGRTRWRTATGPALEWSGDQPAALCWRFLPDGSQHLDVEVPAGATLISRELRIAREGPRFFHLEVPVGDAAWLELIRPVALEDIESVWQSYRKEQGDIPRPFVPQATRRSDHPPRRRLTVDRGPDGTTARLTFDYDNAAVSPASDPDPVAERRGNDIVFHARDWALEATSLGILRRLNWDGGPVDWRLAGGAANLGRFLLEDRPSLESDGWTIVPGPGCPEVEKLELDQLRIDLDGRQAALRDPGTGVNLLGRIGSAVRAGGWLLLEASTGRIVALPGELLRDVQLALGRGHAPTPARLASLPLEVSGGPPSLARLRRLSDFLPEPPLTLKAELRPYQRDGFAWIRRLDRCGFGGILADDMGLGKTVQTLAALAAIYEEDPDAPPSLIVAPLSVLDNWRVEAERFVPKLRLSVYHGQGRRAHWRRARLVLTTYGLLRQEERLFHDRRWRAAVLDEAQAIKNPRSRTARAARGLDADLRLCLTGTPMENHLGELWSLFAFAEPGLLGSQSEFDKVFRDPIEEGDAERHAALVRRVAPFMRRRTREQVLGELPPLVESELRVELGAEQRALYETVRAAAVADLAELDPEADEFTRRGRVLQIITRLRQACCAPALLPEGFPMRDAPSAKLQTLDEMLEELVDEGRHVLVFSQFRGMLDAVRRRLAERGVENLTLTGETRNRGAVIRRFQAGEAPVFLISLKAGGSGLNLTRADTVILLDPWWNPAVEQQAAARAHRMGQQRSVFVYRLIAADTIEDAMQRLKAGKREVGDELSRAVADLDLSDPAVLEELLDNAV